MNTRTCGFGRRGGRHWRIVAAVAGLSLAVTQVPAPAGGTTLATNASAVVRVNQVGYAIGASKRAYLMSPTSAAGATFQLVDEDGRVVRRAPIGGTQGGWSTSYPFVYALDFDSVERAGSYHLAVAGPVSVSSLPFRIDRAADLYAAPLANALSYFRNERDGMGYIPSALRNAPAHLNDVVATTYLTPAVDANGNFSGDLTALSRTIDASGGWWDAGDYIKFVETTSYVVAVLGIGVRDFPGQMGRESRLANFTAEVKFGADFLQRMWDDNRRTLYYQVGIGAGDTAGTIASDHDIWRLPQADDGYQGTDPTYKYIRHRPVFQAGPAGSLISPNLAGRLAADMGLCFQIYRRSDPTYANKCLRSGEHIFDLANTSPKSLVTAIPYGFYPETEWRDDLELGATELARALAGGDLPAGLPHADASYYLQKAAHWARAYITGPNDAMDTLNLFDVSGLAHFELHRAIGAAKGTVPLQITQAELVGDLKKQLTHGLTLAAADPFGFGFPWDTFDTTTHGAGLAVMASEYDQLTHTDAFAAFGTRWLGNIFGANAWGTSLIVGDGTTFPHCMQHQVANLVGSRNGSAPILAGAAVEGPNSFAATGVVTGMRTCPVDGLDSFAPFNGSTAVFQDNVQSYSTVEPAIDLTASSPLAFAWQIVAEGG